MLVNNKKEIIKDINNYYVCEDNNHIIGACGISNLKHNNDYDLFTKEGKNKLYLSDKMENIVFYLYLLL